MLYLYFVLASQQQPDYNDSNGSSSSASSTGSGRDMSRASGKVHFFSNIFLTFLTGFFYRYNITATTTKAAMAATVVAAGCQQHGLETRHVSSCWCVIFLFFCSFSLLLMFVLAPLNTSGQRWQQPQHRLKRLDGHLDYHNSSSSSSRGLETQHVLRCWYVFFFILFFSCI